MTIAAAASLATRAGGALNAAEGVSSLLGSQTSIASTMHSVLTRMGGLIEKYLPGLVATFSVEVAGCPDSDIRRLWYLCVSACVGRMNASSIGETGLARDFVIQWDITGKKVTMIGIVSRTGLMNALIESSDDDGGGNADITGIETIVQEGPVQLTVGAGLPAIFKNAHQRAQKLVANQNRAAVTVVGGRLVTKEKTAREVVPSSAKSFGWSPVVVYRSTVYALSDRNGNYASYLPAVYSPPLRASPNHFREVPIRTPKGVLIIPFRSFSPEVHVRFVSGVTRLRSAKEGAVQLATNSVVAALGDKNSNDAGRPLIDRLDGSSIVGFLNTTSALLKTYYINNRNNTPVMPDDGRIITTPERRDPVVQPPKPIVDGISRNDVLRMISAFLASPGELVKTPTTAGIDDVNVFSDGRFIYPPGDSPHGGISDISLLFREAVEDAIQNVRITNIVVNNEIRIEFPIVPKPRIRDAIEGR